jgi:4-amino-4-deoxy-L-arabinose transferase-like glycosyltransferase
VGTLIFTVGINLWWVASYRGGLPYDIDEAGYLQRAVRDADSLHAGGLTSLWSTVRLPDPQAPLLTVVGGLFRWLTGAGTLEMFAVVQIFYVVAVAATYLAARRLLNRNWSLLAAVMVAALPGLVDGSRTFTFAVPATAMLTATLAAQLHSRVFWSRGLSISWGLLLGLSLLSRTIVIALVPAVMAAAAVDLARSRPRRRQVVNFSAALAIAVVIAGSWYSATWRTVWPYLTGYGYGSDANSYGSTHSVIFLGWWTARLRLAVNSELFVPLALAVAVCFVAGIATWWSTRRGSASGRHGSISPSGAAARALRHPDMTVWVYVVIGYLVLSTSQNAGSYFELPLLPAVCILAASAASRSVPFLRPYVAAVCLLAAAVSFAGVSEGIPGVSSSSVTVSVGSVGLTAFDGRGTLLGYASTNGGGCRPTGPCTSSGTTPGEIPYLREWLAPSQRMAALLRSDAVARGCDPVVFFAVEDPLFNTNTVDLAYQLAFSQSLPTGLLKARDHAGGESPFGQLNDPARGIPNLVITGLASVRSPNWASLVAPRVAAMRAIQQDGFVPRGGVRLPDGRTMSVWWKDRGPCGPGRP